MRVLAWIVLALILLIILGMVYYLVVGEILFKFAFSRKKSRVRKKQIDKQIKDFKIDLCWWQKQKLEKVSIKSFDGLKLSGYFLNNDSQKTVIIFHGYGGEYHEMQQYCKFFFDKNFNVLLVDNRTHGESEGNCIGFGWLDRKDVLFWIDFLNNKIPNSKIVLFGLSMGATAVCCASGEELPKNVVAIISDCAFANLKMQMQYVMRKHKILWKIFKNHLFSFVKHIHDFDINQADAIKQVKNTKVPILFIHGQSDSFVPVENLTALYNATPDGKKSKYVEANADHAMAYSVGGVLYEKKINDFLNSYTNL